MNLSKRQVWILGEDGKERDKHGRIRCPHGRIRRRCRKCGDGGICEHGRRRYVCSRCSPEGAYKTCAARAARREITFELSLEDFKWLVSSPCSSCEKFLSLWALIE